MNYIKLIKNQKLFIFIFFLLFINTIFSQRRNNKEELPQKPPIYFETHVVPNDSVYTCFVSFKIPYSNLLFVKENGSFKSEIAITYKLLKDKKFYSRKVDKKTISITEYERTKDSKLFLEGITSFNIEEGEYRISPSILLGNTDIDFKSMPLKLSVDATHVSKPFVVYDGASCDSSNTILANFQNTIPFSKNEYDLLIPIYSKNDIALSVEVKQNEKLILEKRLTKFESFNSDVSVCRNQVILTSNNNSELVKYFRLNFVNKNLLEGDAKIFIKSENLELEFDLKVFWNEKPKSLFNSEEAIEAITHIGYKNVADSLSDIDDDEQYQSLFNFWSRFDDDNTTSFNEVFYEYYSRIDFVREEFNSLSKDDGLETDRGKTYLFYGEPDKVERTYSEIYNVLEVWIYNSIHEKIYFSDKTGMGKFERIK